MSIRLRLTLMYSAILALTLLLFGGALYTIQARSTLEALKSDLLRTGEGIGAAVLFRHTHPPREERQTLPLQRGDAPPPVTFEVFSGEPAFQQLREREIVRVLDAQGALVASPFGDQQDALPLSGEGLQALQAQQDWWEVVPGEDGRLLIYSRPVVSEGELIGIVQAARPLAERDRSLAGLGTTLLIAGVITLLAAFGAGWMLSGLTLRPIDRITQTAGAIGRESDFTRRVDYQGPNDEVGQLATTFNAMLERLQEAYQRISQALKQQRDFVADVSHELRTPLTTVRGNLALLRRNPPLPADEQADILADAVDESDRLIRLVNGLLVLARADAGQSLRCEAVALQPLVEDACRQARRLDPQREITALVEPLAVLGDRDALKQVLWILLDNAIKYTHGPLSVAVEALGGQVELRVQDSGPGMPAEALEHVFDRFYRGEEASGAAGFGLGLSIARALVEAMGGKIRMESAPEKGSTVYVRLQATEAVPE
jgi:signal transduction histidine kinase